MKKVAAVVVTHDRLTLLRDNLAHLKQQTLSCDILLVDNASSDGTQEYIRTHIHEYPGLRYRRLEQNNGGAGGFNCGMRWAVEAGYDYVWIMDDDCMPQSDALEKLMEADTQLSKRVQYGFLASAVLWTDGRECAMNRPLLSRGYFAYLELVRLGIVQIHQATFVSLLFPRRTILQFGLPIRDYFIWGDDIEYTRRIAVRGKIPCFLAGGSQVIHAMKSNTGSDIAIDTIDRLDRYERAFRNERFTYSREGLKGWCRYGLRCARGYWRILRYAKDYRLRRLCMLTRGIWRGLFFHPKIERIQDE